MPKIRWTMILLCFFALAVSYIDRVNLAIAAPYIKRDLAISDTSMGLMLGAFFWTYALLQIPAGWLLDRIGARAGLALAVGWWSFFTILTGAMRSVSTLFGCRLFLGVGEAAVYPGGAKVIYAWFPKAERGMASGIFDAGPRAGTAIALPIVTSAIGIWGWEASFYVTGLIGFVWLACWIAIYKEPEDHHSVDPHQLTLLQEARGRPISENPQTIEPWYTLLRHRTIWGMMIGFFCFNFVNYFFLTWFPTYLVMAKGFSLGQLGTLGALPALMSIPGSLLGGWSSDQLFKRGVSLTASRKICLVAGLLVSSFITLAVLVDGIYVALLLFSIANAGLAFTAANIWTLPADVAPSPDRVATIGGLQNFASNLAGVVTTAFTGLMLSISGGSFAVPLTVAGAVSILGALAYLIIVGTLEPLYSKTQSEPPNGLSRPSPI
jgi:ACS family D-galactonate transporter-like MFS transporter